MKLGQREKNLLIIVGVVLVVFLCYFFGFRNLMARNDEVSAEVQKLTERYNTLESMKAKLDDYVADKKAYDEYIKDFYTRFDTGASQEYTIKFLEGVENETDTWVKTATITQPEQIFTFGSITSSNPTTSGALVYQSDYIGYSISSTISFESSYEEFKHFLEYIVHNKYKCTLESLSVSYSAEEDLVSGSCVVTQFSIAGSDREFGPTHTTNPFFGTENIFSSSIFDPETMDEADGSDILSDYDVYLSLQSHETDVPALKMGFKTDSTKTIINEENDVKKVTLKVTGQEGDYKISYKVGNVTYPVDNYAEGAEFVPGVKLSLLVNCSNRTSINDESGAEVTLINESDMTLFVKVINDDESAPRFKVDDKRGDIIIYQD